MALTTLPRFPCPHVAHRTHAALTMAKVLPWPPVPPLRCSRVACGVGNGHGIPRLQVLGLLDGQRQEEVACKWKAANHGGLLGVGVGTKVWGGDLNGEGIVYWRVPVGTTADGMVDIWLWCLVSW